MMLVLLALSVAFHTVQFDEVEARARKAFDDGVAQGQDPAHARTSFAAAADEFATIIRDHPSPAAYRNLGNASYLAGRLPEAIVAFRNGLQLDPSDLALRESLRRARPETPAGSTIPTGFGLPTRWPRFWGWIESGLFLIACATLPYGFRAQRRFPRLLGILAATCYTVIFATAFFHRSDEAPILVARESTILRVGNGLSYGAAATLPRGQEVRWRDQRGSWKQVECPDGTLGWLPDAALLGG